MQLGIIGLPGAGRSTIFQALTRCKPVQQAHMAPCIGTVQVSDPRVDTLHQLFKPKKTVYAHLVYVLPQRARGFIHDGKGDETFWGEVRPCDALVHVVSNFHQPGGEPPQPHGDWRNLESEMIFADLIIAEKRIERINLDKKRGKKINEEELGLLEACCKVLEGEEPLRDDPEIAHSPLLKGYAFLSAKPALIIFNNDEEDENLPVWQGPSLFDHALVVRGKLEKELAELPPDEATAFLEAYQIDGFAMERVIQHSCKLLGLISFFTVVHDEVRSWLIPGETTALDAAGIIHSDMKKGFIRAEVLAYDDLIAAGTYQQAKKEAKVRLEAKTYIVQDGDVVYFRFNV